MIKTINSNMFVPYKSCKRESKKKQEKRFNKQKKSIFKVNKAKIY